MSCAAKLNSNDQKKLLALDGGGIRGVIALEVLQRIEAILREQSGNSKLVLADYFDYVAGTSTGAIIAALIALGKTVDEILDFYVQHGRAIFKSAGVLKRFWYKFSGDPLSALLREVVGDIPLGDDRLRTLLMMVMRNATTDSAWPVSNNPAARFNAPSYSGCNLRVPLWQLIRASTAAPTYFPPQQVTIGEHEFLFVDGGVSAYNNPAFQLFLMATLPEYGVRWTAAADRMLLVSVGTGASSSPSAHLTAGDMNMLYQASAIPTALIGAAMHQQDLLCRAFGNTVAGEALDLEVGDGVHTSAPGGRKLFTYARYNASLSREGLRSLGLDAIDPSHVRALDAVERVPEMRQVGRAIAQLRVKPEHFATFPPQRAFAISV